MLSFSSGYPKRVSRVDFPREKDGSPFLESWEQGNHSGAGGPRLASLYRFPSLVDCFLPLFDVDSMSYTLQVWVTNRRNCSHLLFEYWNAKSCEIAVGIDSPTTLRNRVIPFVQSLVFLGFLSVPFNFFLLRAVNACFLWLFIVGNSIEPIQNHFSLKKSKTSERNIGITNNFYIKIISYQALCIPNFHWIWYFFSWTVTYFLELVYRKMGGLQSLDNIGWTWNN